MDQVQLATLIKWAINTLAVAFLLAVAIPPAAGENDDPTKAVIVEAALTEDTITQGEPLTLRCNIINKGTEEIRALLGREHDEWLSLTLMDANGRSLPAINVPPPPRDPGGGISAPLVGVRNGGNYEEWLVVSQRFTIPRAGKYRLKVDVHLPYVTGQGQYFLRQPPFSDTVVVQTILLPITVTAQNPSRLRSVAQELHAAIIKDTNVGRIKARTDALFSMPMSYALPTWRALATDARLYEHKRKGVIEKLNRKLNP